MENVTLENLIDKAIMREEEAFEFYSKLGNKVTDTMAKDALKFLAGQEKEPQGISRVIQKRENRLRRVADDRSHRL